MIFRTANQTYILWEIESPAYLLGFQPSHYGNFFNWTMTYRQDSTVSIPYGKLRKLKEHPENGERLDQLIDKFGENNKHLAERKGNSSVRVAWMVSNCLTKSNREGYVEALKKFIDVDVYGSCYKDSKKCEKDGSDNCWNYISDHYKFYLSFENSLCNDYITEKFWEPLKRNIVPIVLGKLFFNSQTHTSLSIKLSVCE